MYMLSLKRAINAVSTFQTVFSARLRESHSSLKKNYTLCQALLYISIIIIQPAACDKQI